MGAPCIDDSCNIKAMINPATKHLMLQALVSPRGGLLDCIGPAEGLGINLLGEFENADPGPQGLISLGITPGGELWVAPKLAQRNVFSGAITGAPPQQEPVNIPSGANTGTDSANAIGEGNQFTNPFPSSALFLIDGAFELGWTIANHAATKAIITTGGGNGLWMPYAAEIQMVFGLRPAGSPTVSPVKTSFASISGVWPQQKLPHNGRERKTFTYAGIIQPGQTINMSAVANFIVPNDPNVTDPSIGSYPYNLSFINPNTAPVFRGRGFNAQGTVTVLPIGAS